MSPFARTLALIGLALALSRAPASARQTAVITGAPGALAALALSIEASAPTVARPGTEPLSEEDSVLRFCAGLGAATPDGLALLRRLRFEERERCAANGVGELAELDLGTVGFIVAGAPAENLTRRILWRALAGWLLDDGRIVANRSTTWRAIDPALPQSPIRLAGPDPASPLGALLAQLVLEEACESVPALARRLVREPTSRPTLCAAIRSDGAYRTGSPDEAGWTRLLPITALGRAGDGAAIEGVRPDPDSLESGKYPLARRLWLTVKRAHIEAIQGLADLQAALGRRPL